ncbi:MAG: glycosyltransferase [Holophagales bacterium]|nr:MAG: glycosyltransferase [Holophagales bacterium]
MTRALVCGLCPLPVENTLKSHGPGLRSWQLARSLAHDGHEVRLLAMRISDGYLAGEGPSEEEIDGVRVIRVSESELLRSNRVSHEISRWEPDAVVGATIYGSYALARAKPRQPFWADQFGHVMAEAQAKAALDGNNRVLPYFWQLVQPVLARCDKLSVVSEHQRFAAIGELGTTGRLSAETCGYEFTEVIPCAQVPFPDPHPALPALRGTQVPADAFLAIWSGSYNVWSDVQTLFSGIESAMQEDPSIHFVSTGGEIHGQDETTYRDFRSLVERSAMRSRFHLEGWVRAARVPDYWAEADLGILAERPIYEGWLGSKNRVVQWMGFGLPVLYNRVGTLGDLLEAEELGLTFEAGDVAGLRQQLLWAARRPAELRRRAERARTHVRESLSLAASALPLRTWMRNPSRAPDAMATRKTATPNRHRTWHRSLLAPVGESLGPSSAPLIALWRRLNGRR